MDRVNEDVRNTPLFAFMAQELSALTSLISDRDLDLRMLNRRINQLEQMYSELEWRMESYEAFTARMLVQERDASIEVIHEIVGENDYYNGDLLQMLMEIETEEEEDPFDWDAWFPETVEI